MSHVYADDGAISGPDHEPVVAAAVEETGGVETDVYDNGVQQPISAGSIVIHAK